MNLSKVINNIDNIQKKIQYFFRDKILLIQSFIHSSVCNGFCQIELDGKSVVIGNNQRFEFLGDGILDYIASEYVYLKYPTFSEDFLSSYKSLIVNYYTLYKVCVFLNLQEFLVFNYDSLGKNSTNIKNYGDIVEALIGSIYLDSQNIDCVKNFFYNVILKVFNDNLEDIVENLFDWKGFLQSLLQKRGIEVPKYSLIDKNQDGFYIVAYLNSIEVSSGFGRTKKEAEKQAALNFIKKIEL